MNRNINSDGVNKVHACIALIIISVALLGAIFLALFVLTNIGSVAHGAQFAPPPVQVERLTPEQKEVIRQWINAPKDSTIEIDFVERTEHDQGKETEKGTSIGVGAGVRTDADNIAQVFTGSAPASQLGARGRGGSSAGGDAEQDLKAQAAANLFKNPFIWVAIALGLGAGFLAYRGLIRPATFAGAGAAGFAVAALFPGAILVAAIVGFALLAFPYVKAELEKHEASKRIGSMSVALNDSYADRARITEGLRAVVDGVTEAEKSSDPEHQKAAKVVKSFIGAQADDQDRATISAAKKL